MRAEAAPPDSTTQAKRIQKAGLVVADALRQQAALPLDGGSFKAFKLEKGVEGAFFAGKLRAFRKMLPVQQPAHVGGGRDGFYLFAEIAERETVNALQNAALTPFDFGVVCGGFLFEDAAKGEALHLDGDKLLKDGARLKTRERRDLPGGRGAE